jgi:uncharacterized protein YggL (DUF469 family)
LVDLVLCSAEVVSAEVVCSVAHTTSNPKMPLHEFDREKVQAAMEVARKLKKRMRRDRTETHSIRIKKIAKAEFPDLKFTLNATKMNRRAHDQIYEQMSDLIAEFVERNKVSAGPSAIKRMIELFLLDVDRKTVDEIFDDAQKMHAEFMGHGTSDVTIAKAKPKKQRTGPASFESKYKNKKR